jgi:hypothetical protein
LAVEAKNKGPDPAVANGAVLTARVDAQLVAVAWLEPRWNTKRRIGRKVARAFERSTFLWFDG